MKKEDISEWKNAYKSVSNNLLDINKLSPENFIDEIKLDYLRPYLPESGTVIELGAGSGRFITRISIENPQYQIIGLDYVKESTKIIQSNILKFNLNGTAIYADIFHLPFKDNSFEAIMSGGLLEHFNEKEIDNVIKEMKRVLKQNGLFYAEIVPKKFSLCRPVILHDIGGYENSFNKKQWEYILKQNRFINVKVVSGLVIPPNTYEWFKSGIMLKILYRFKSLMEFLDNTKISNLMGFSYYVIGYKSNITKINFEE